MTGRIAGKVAIVTGAASGIGEAIAMVFASEGAKVVIADVQDEKGQAVAARIGDAALFVHLDVTKPDQWTDSIAQAEKAFGPVTVLVNNAGASTGVARIDEEDPADHQYLVNLNITGVWNGMRAVIPGMRANGGGSIINMSSMNGLVGAAGMATYAATKFAVTGFTRSVALELGAMNIRVNSIHPGVIETPGVAGLTQEIQEQLRQSMKSQAIKRLGKPEEVARTALFFASDDSSYCSGSMLLVDGGHIAGRYRDLEG